MSPILCAAPACGPSGGSDDAMNLFRNFTGGEPDIKPLLERRGLDAPAK